MEMDALIKGLLEQVAELTKSFNVEKDAKDKAYDFIISNGYFKQYSEWHSQHVGENHHLNCVLGLISQE